MWKEGEGGGTEDEILLRKILSRGREIFPLHCLIFLDHKLFRCSLRVAPVDEMQDFVSAEKIAFSRKRQGYWNYY